MGIPRKDWPTEVTEFDTGLTPAEQLSRLATHWQRAEYCYDQMHKLRSRYYRGQRIAEFDARTSQTDPTLKGQKDSVRKLIGQRRWASSTEASDIIALEQMWSRWASLECSMANLNRHPRGEHPQ